jgi:hypothetical protein
MIPLDEYIKLTEDLQRQLDEFCPLLKFDVWKHDKVKVETLKISVLPDPYLFEHFVYSVIATINGVPLSTTETAHARVLCNENESGLWTLRDEVAQEITYKAVHGLANAILCWRPEQGD